MYMKKKHWDDLSKNVKTYCQGRRNEKRARGADFVEGHRQNFNYVKIHTLEFRGSVAFLLCQILTDHILSIASAITLDIINTSHISSIDSVTAAPPAPPVPASLHIVPSFQVKGFVRGNTKRSNTRLGIDDTRNTIVMYTNIKHYRQSVLLQADKISKLLAATYKYTLLQNYVVKI